MSKGNGKGKGLGLLDKAQDDAKAADAIEKALSKSKELTSVVGKAKAEFRKAYDNTYGESKAERKAIGKQIGSRHQLAWSNCFVGPVNKTMSGDDKSTKLAFVSLLRTAVGEMDAQQNKLFNVAVKAIEADTALLPDWGKARKAYEDSGEVKVAKKALQDAIEKAFGDSDAAIAQAYNELAAYVLSKMDDDDGNDGADDDGADDDDK